MLILYMPYMAIIDKASKDARNKRIFDMWMACYTQEETAGKEDITKETVSDICQKMADLPKSDKALAEHAVDFEIPIYNIWKQQENKKAELFLTLP